MKRKPNKRTKSTTRRAARRDPSRCPKGWNRKRVQALVDHYENQSDDDAIAEAEAAYKNGATAMIQVPIELVPRVQRLLARRAG